MNTRKIAACVGACFLVMATAVAGLGGEGGSPAKAPDSALVGELQERLLGDPAVMGLVMALQSEPEVQALLNDPKVVAAVQAGDYSALLNDPRLLKLLDNAQVKEIGKRLEDQNSGGKE